MQHHIHPEANTAALIFIVAACVILVAAAITFVRMQRGSERKAGPVD